MSHSPHITLVIPTMNEQKYILPLITAIKNQTYTNFEVICIDKSSDTTPKLCRDAGWKVYRQTGKTISSVRQQGFSLARGDIIASTDADSAPSRQWLETINRIFTDQNVVCAYGPTYFFEKSIIFRLMGQFNLIFLKITRLFGSDQIFGMNFAVRKTAYQQIGGYNTSLPTAEDVDLGYRIRKVGKVVYHPQMIVYTSSRRLKAQKLGFFTHHLKNFIRLKFFGTASSDFKPIR